MIAMTVLAMVIDSDGFCHDIGAGGPCRAGPCRAGPGRATLGFAPGDRGGNGAAGVENAGTRCGPRAAGTHTIMFSPFPK